MLGEDSTRASAAASIDRVRTAFTMFAPVPFEDRLAEFDPGIDRLTGGRRLEILERIATARAAWADEVADGEGRARRLPPACRPSATSAACCRTPPRCRRARRYGKHGRGLKFTRFADGYVRAEASRSAASPLGARRECL